MLRTDTTITFGSLAIPIAICLSAGAGIAAEKTPPITQPVSDGIALVRAITVKTQERNGMVEGTLRVRDIYWGDHKVRGREFVAMSSVSRDSTTGGDLHPPLKQGEEGIWLVRVKGGDELVPIRSYRWGVYWPVREKVTQRYKQAKELAQMLHRVHNAETVERRNMLRKFAVNNIPEVSICAIHMLSRIKLEGAKAFLEGLLTNKGLSISGQVAVDEALVKLDRHKWLESPNRTKLFEQWVAGKRDSFDASRVIGRIDVSWQLRETSTERTLALVKTMALNEGMPLAVREQCCRFAGRVAMREKDDDKAFKLLVEFIQRKKEPSIGIAAAYAIGHSVGTDKARLAAIRTVRMEVADQKVRKILGEAIERAEKALKSKTEKSRQPKP